MYVYLWDYIKDKVCSMRSIREDELRVAIEEQSILIPEEIVIDVCISNSTGYKLFLQGDVFSCNP